MNLQTFWRWIYLITNASWFCCGINMTYTLSNWCLHIYRFRFVETMAQWWPFSFLFRRCSFETFSPSAANSFLVVATPGRPRNRIVQTDTAHSTNTEFYIWFSNRKIIGWMQRNLLFDSDFVSFTFWRRSLRIRWNFHWLCATFLLDDTSIVCGMKFVYCQHIYSPQSRRKQLHSRIQTDRLRQKKSSWCVTFVYKRKRSKICANVNIVGELVLWVRVCVWNKMSVTMSRLFFNDNGIRILWWNEINFIENPKRNSRQWNMIAMKYRRDCFA